MPPSPVPSPDTIARALEIAAEAVGMHISPARAVSAAAEARPGASTVPAFVAAARAAGLRVWPIDPDLPRVLEGTCKLPLLPHGDVVVVLGKLGRRIRVARVAAQGTTFERWSPRKLARRDGKPQWFLLAPHLPLHGLSGSAPTAVRRGRWRRLLALLKLDRRDLGVVATYAVVVGALTLATPVAIQSLVNTVALGAVLQPLVILSLLLLGVLLLQGVLRVFQIYVVEVLQRRVFVRVLEDFGRRIPMVRAEALDGRHGPELVHRFFDVVTVQKTLASLLIDGLALVLQTGVGMLLLAFYHPFLLAFDLVLVLLFAGVVLLGRGALGTATAESDAKYRAAAWLSDLSRAHHLLRGHRPRTRVETVTAALCRDWLGARARHFRILLRQVAGGVALQVLALVALLGVGGWLVIARQLTLGQLVAAEIVVTAMAAGFAKLGKALETLYDLDVGVHKLEQVAELPMERSGGEAPGPRGPLSVTLVGVWLDRGERAILKGADLHVPAMARLQLVGAPGTGLSTVLELLAGLRRPKAGTIRYDGLDRDRSDLGALRDGIVLLRGNDPYLAGSVLDNLALWAPHPLTEPEAHEILRTVGLLDAVDHLSRGLDTPLQPSGAPLSSHHRRRLALARALAACPRLLLVDRGLDDLGMPPEELQGILEAVLSPDAPWTVVLVTGDPRVARFCNLRVHLKHGRLVRENGP